MRVEAEDLATGETWHVGSAYLVFVALDADGKPVPVPPLLPESETEQRRQLEAAGAEPCAAGRSGDSQASRKAQAEMKPPST